MCNLSEKRAVILSIAFYVCVLLTFCCSAEEEQKEINQNQAASEQGVAALPADAPVESEDMTYEKSVVMLEIVQQEWDYRMPWKQSAMGRGVGTGFIIDGKRILTNAHNVGNIKYMELKKQNIAKRYPAEVVFVAHDCDLAIVDVEDKTFYEGMVPLEFGGIPKVNSKVTTCGFPVGGRQVSITEGVVSRIEVGNYSHTQADMHLLVQTDAAINPGNSGGPVLQDGKVVGVAFQGLQSADNIGFMIPTTVIQHFLNDIQDGSYDGFPSPAVSIFEGLHNPAYKAYCKVPQSAEGIIVMSVQINSTAENIFKPGDVLTQIDGYNIDNDGMIKIYGLSLDWSEALEKKQIGETIDVGFWRDGKFQKAVLKAAINTPILPWGLQFDKQPQYYVYAGLTFTPLSRNFLQTFGRSWITDMPFPLRYLFHNSMQLNDDPNLKEYVVLSEILPDEVNDWCSSFKNQVVNEINGTKVKSLKDIRSLLGKKNESGYHIIKFLGNDMELILDINQVNQRNKSINEKYQVSTDTYIQE